MGPRVYDPFFGRFLQPDPAWPRDSASPYSYAGHDPVNLTDPTGLCLPRRGSSGSGGSTGSGSGSGAGGGNRYLGEGTYWDLRALKLGAVSEWEMSTQLLSIHASTSGALLGTSRYVTCDALFGGGFQRRVARAFPSARILSVIFNNSINDFAFAVFRGNEKRRLWSMSHEGGAGIHAVDGVLTTNRIRHDRVAGSGRQSLWVGPTAAHGMWLEFRQRSGAC